MLEKDLEFECYAKNRNLRTDTLGRDEGDSWSYYSFVTHEAWLSWQACKASLANKKTV